MLPQKRVAQRSKVEAGQRIEVIEPMPMAIARELVRISIAHAAVAAFDAIPNIQLVHS